METDFKCGMCESLGGKQLEKGNTRQLIHDAQPEAHCQVYRDQIWINCYSNLM